MTTESLAGNGIILCVAGIILSIMIGIFYCALFFITMSFIFLYIIWFSDSNDNG